MPVRSAKKTVAYYILLACGVVLAVALAIYGWAVEGPTGFEKLPKETALNRKVPKKPSALPPAPKRVIVHAPAAQSAPAPAPAPTPAVVSPMLTDELYNLPSATDFYRASYFLRPVRGGWITVATSSLDGTGRIPEDQIMWMREHYPWSLSRTNVMGAIGAGFPKAIQEVEARLWNGNAWPEPTAADVYGKFSGTNHDIVLKLAALTAIASAARGDVEEANTRMQTVIAQSVRINRLAMGKSSNLVDYLLSLDAMDSLTSTTFDAASRLVDDGIVTRQDYEEQRKANIRVRAEAIKKEAESWEQRNSVRTYFLDGVPDRWVRAAVLPATKNAIERYAVAIAGRDEDEIMAAELGLDAEIALMNASAQIDLRQQFRESPDESMLGMYGAAQLSGKSLSPFSSDPPAAGLYRANASFFHAQFVIACIRYRQKNGRWPDRMEELYAGYLPPGFAAGTGSEWLIMRPDPIEVFKLSEDPYIRGMIEKYQAKDSTHSFPTNSRQLANFMNMKDDEPLRSMFETVQPDIVAVEIRRHPVYELNGHKVFDYSSTEKKDIGQGYTLVNEEVIETTFFFLPQREELLGMTKYLVGEDKEKPTAQ